MLAEARAAIVCPMGEAVQDSREGKGPGCFCRVARELLTRETDTRSLQRWCAADYADCPTWRAFRDAEMADQHRDLAREVARTVPRALR